MNSVPYNVTCLGAKRAGRSIRLTVIGSVLLAGLCLVGGWHLRAQTSVAGLTRYEIGDPSGDETAVLELLNRTRANPPAQGQRLTADIDPAVYGGLQDEYQAVVAEILTSFATYPFRPPLAFNARLNAAARFHLAENLGVGRPDHDSPDGTRWDTRIESFGYPSVTGQNCAGTAGYPAVFTPWNTEATYESDLGHRPNILEPHFVQAVEVGIASRALGGWSVQNFGGNSTPPLLTGVAYRDDASTGFYASGEGVGGVTVTAPGASSFYTVTTASGAYTLPLDLLPAYNAAAPLASVTVQTDYQGSSQEQAVPLTHTVTPDGSTYYQYDDASQTTAHLRYDNAKADWVFPGSSVVTPSPDPTPSPTSPPSPSPQTVEVTVAAAGTGNRASFVLIRTGDSSQPLRVSYQLTGSAKVGRDYLPPGSPTKRIKAGQSSARLNVTLLSGATGTLKLKVRPADGYVVGAASQAKWKLRP